MTENAHAMHSEEQEENAVIGILTLNPCVDQTLFVREIASPGETNVLRKSLLAGGKGNNVARVAHRLGASVLSMVLVAGKGGQLIRSLLEKEGLPCDFFELEGHSRYITTVVDRKWRQTILREKTVISDPDVPAVRDWVVSRLSRLDMLCICGSVPSPQFDSLPAQLIREARRRGIPVLLDTTGEALRLGLLAKPQYCKPNQEETAALFPEDCVQVVQAMHQHGIERPIISMGAQGALSVEDGRVIHIEGPRIKAVNPVGSGDSFVAGLIYSLGTGRPWRECLAFATACGAANAAKWAVADVGRGEVEMLYGQVRIEEVGV